MHMKFNPERIAVFCPNWVGDVVMATPVFLCLRRNFPEADLLGVIRTYARGVIEDGPWFDNILEIKNKSHRAFFDTVKTLRGIRPDLAVLLPNSFRSAAMAWLGGSKRIVGYRRDVRSLLLSGGPTPQKGKDGIIPVPMVHYYMELCKYMELDISDSIKPSLFFSDRLNERANSLLEKYGIQKDKMVIGINPGASFGSSKCWPPENFARLADLFSEKWDCKIILFTGPGEEPIAEAIVDAANVTVINPSSDKVGLALLKPLIKRCGLLVTNDTGTRHYGVALDVPTVVIIGPMDPAYTAANLEKTRVIRKVLDCSPCNQNKCPLEHHACMMEITPEEVLAESVKLLEKI